MKKLAYAEVNLAIIEPNVVVRRALKEALNRLGIENVDDGGRFDELEGILGESPQDLLICDAALEDGDVCALSQEIRHGAVGANPFMVLMTTTEMPTEGTVHRIIDSGPDCIIAKPLSIKAVLDRVTILSQWRRPFYVSSDYIGPQRLADSRSGMAMPTMPVPNSLAAKVNGTFDAECFGEEIKETMARVMEQKVVHHSKMINTIVRQILPFYGSGTVTDAVLIHLDRLLRVGSDISVRVAGTADDHIAPLCTSLVKVTKSIKAKHRSPDAKDLNMLRTVSLAIYKAFQPDENVAELSHDIAASIGASRRYAAH